MPLGVTITGTAVLSASDRDRILQAMADCCARCGYAETTVEAVVERAGVEPESFEVHFSSKEDCALAALNKMVSDTLAQVSMTGPKGTEPTEQRRFQIRAILELLAAKPSFAYLGFIGARQGGSRQMHASYESAAGVLALMMEREGGPNEHYPIATRAALGGAEALVRRELAAGRGAGLPQLLPNFVYAALVPFVGQGEALRQAKLAAKVAAEEE